MIAASGREALSQIQAGVVFDIAILDMNLPDMNGITLAEEIRTYRRDLPLMALASMGHGQPSELFAASLKKPIKPAQLYDTITGVLAGQAVQMQDQDETADKNDVSQNSLRILLAEDNVSSQKVALKMLEKLGYRADLASNGIDVRTIPDRHSLLRFSGAHGRLIRASARNLSSRGKEVRAPADH